MDYNNAQSKNGKSKTGKSKTGNNETKIKEGPVENGSEVKEEEKVEGPEVKVEGPEVKVEGPEVKVEGPEVKVEGQGENGQVEKVEEEAKNAGDNKVDEITPEKFNETMKTILENLETHLINKKIELDENDKIQDIVTKLSNEDFFGTFNKELYSNLNKLLVKYKGSKVFNRDLYVGNNLSQVVYSAMLNGLIDQEWPDEEQKEVLKKSLEPKSAFGSLMTGMTGMTGSIFGTKAEPKTGEVVAQEVKEGEKEQTEVVAADDKKGQGGPEVKEGENGQRGPEVKEGENGQRGPEVKEGENNKKAKGGGNVRKIIKNKKVFKKF